jgi:hypothetical protein
MTGGKCDIVAPYPFCQAEPARHKDFCCQSCYQTAKARQRQEDGCSSLAQQDGARDADSKTMVGDESRRPVCCATRHDRTAASFALETRIRKARDCCRNIARTRLSPGGLVFADGSGIPGFAEYGPHVTVIFLRCVQLFGIAGRMSRP